MQRITQLIGILCIASFIMGMLLNLGQFPTTEKAVKFVIALFIIVTMFKPIAINDIKLDMDFVNVPPQQLDNKNDIIEAEIIKRTTKNIVDVIKDRLDKKNISYFEVTVHILNQDDNLLIEQINITGCDESERKKIYTCLEDLVSEEEMIVLGE